MTTLAEALRTYGSKAYLLTVAPDGPHTSHVDVVLDGARIHCAVGASARRNARENQNVSLLWAPPEPGGYSIVVNGELTLDSERGDQATVTITKSVFHRPGPSRVPGGACTSDCEQLALD